MSADNPAVPPEWRALAEQAAARKQKMLSFGAHARGLLVEAKEGLFVVDPEDNSVTGILLNYGDFHPHELELARSFLTPDSDVLVVGSHIGGHVVPLSRSCRELIAIEANPRTFWLLECNLRLNGCGNVTPYNLAASNKVESIEFLMNRDNSGGSKRKPIHQQFYYNYDDPEVVRVDAVPLDELLGEREFDLIFMDIEGSEYFALTGMSKILAKAKALSVEFLPHAIANVAGVGGQAFVDAITPHFNWMYIPGQPSVVEQASIGPALTQMYNEGVGHDGIYFMKSLSEKWLQDRGLARPLTP